MNDLLTRLNMNHISDYFDECYEKALRDTSLPEWLTEKYIRDGAEEFPYFSTELEKIIGALDEVKKNADLVLFAKTLYIMMESRRHPDEIFEGLEFPKAPEGSEPLGYDIFSFYPLFARTRDTVINLLNSGADKEIIKKSFSAMDGCIVSSTKAEGRFSLNKIYFLWLAICKNAVVFRVGRFNLELREAYKSNFFAFTNSSNETKILMDNGYRVHFGGQLLGSSGTNENEECFLTEFKETDTYYEGYAVNDNTATVESIKSILPKNQWSLFCKPGDDIISIHIPGAQPFSKEIVESSIDEGRRFFKKLYPDKDIKAFICISWLISPALKSILKPTSNIIEFQNLFTKFPHVSVGLDVFNFVFRKSVSKLSDIDINLLPENTSLEKGLKEIYKSGNCIYETGGIFKF